jgi:hypothetical protein
MSLLNNRIQRLFLEASMTMGISPKGIQQAAKSLLGAIQEAYNDGKSAISVVNYYGNQPPEFIQLFNQLLNDIDVEIESRSSQYNVGKKEAAKGILPIILSDIDNFIKKSLEYDENFFAMFDESELDDMIEGAEDSIDVGEYYRALVFLVGYINKKRTNKDLHIGRID